MISVVKLYPLWAYLASFKQNLIITAVFFIVRHNSRIHSKEDILILKKINHEITFTFYRNNG
jgi:hypothetical protein